MKNCSLQAVGEQFSRSSFLFSQIGNPMIVLINCIVVTDAKGMSPSHCSISLLSSLLIALLDHASVAMVRTIYAHSRPQREAAADWYHCPLSRLWTEASDVFKLNVRMRPLLTQPIGTAAVTIFVSLRKTEGDVFVFNSLLTFYLTKFWLLVSGLLRFWDLTTPQFRWGQANHTL